MSALIDLKNIDLSFGGPMLLENANLTIQVGHRTCMVGRNGCGKSSLLKLLSGEIKADEGKVKVEPLLKIGYLPQDIPKSLSGNALDIAFSESDSEESYLDQTPVLSMLDRLGISPDQPYSAMSGGQKRRTILARALSGEPDLILLDEPTNHLDGESIEWLENWLKRPGLSSIFISHDRRFIENLADQVIDVDRGEITLWEGSFDNYQRRREEHLHARQLHEQRFLKRLSEEEVWIRKGIQARRTRNEGRVRQLKKMRDDFRKMRGAQGNAKLQIGDSAKSGKLIFTAENIAFAYDKQPIVKSFSSRIQRGERIGIVGPNGAGKSTLINLFLGELKPDSGELRLGTQLDVAYFDQQRSSLNNKLSAIDNVSGGRESIDVGGKQRHIISFMQDFLFTPDQARGPIDKFSGGELSRLLLARLFSKGFNLLIMDEPTNDLDIETLELLEDQLLNFNGTLLVSSHDRTFLDNVVTSVIHLDGKGNVEQYPGGYSDWQKSLKTMARENAATTQHKGSLQKIKKPKPKLSYKLQRELDELPKRIEQLETSITAIQLQMSQPGFYEQSVDLISKTTTELEQKEQELEHCFGRWDELEASA
ncbi:MAG: ATP-binding cassette subfamily F protein uup [Parasphingorhabdus sp.]